MTSRNYGYFKSIDDLAKVVKSLSDDDSPIGFDLETGYEGPPRTEASLAWHASTFIVGFSFTNDPKWARYVPLRHDFCDENLPEDDVWEIMKPLLEQPRIVPHNAKFEKRGCRTVGIELGIRGCSMLEAYVLSRWPSTKLKVLTKLIFNHDQREIHELFPKAKKKELKQLRFNTLSLTPDVVSYACEDSAWGLALHLHNLPLIEADPKLRFVYQLELQIMEIVADFEDHGVLIDWPQAERWLAESQDFLVGIEDEVRADFGALVGRSLKGLNVKSPTQLRTIFFDEPPRGLGLPITRETTTGLPSTDAIALTHIVKRDKHIEDEACEAGDHSGCSPDPAGAALKKLLKAREVDNHRKRFELWLDVDEAKYPVRGTDGRVHANYAQHIVGTGRFAASGPAIQQCPKKWHFVLRDGREFNGNFRDLIIPTPGMYLIGFDYSQIELRAIAGLAQERSLIEAFERGDDVHSLTAAKMLGKALEDVDEEKDRPTGKTMNFALIYQMGWRSLAARLGIPLERARELYFSYFANFPAIGSYVERCKQQCKMRVPLPYTQSYFGRRWTIWNLANTGVSPAQYATGERQSVNAPVQGWAADYMKIAMVRAVLKLKHLGWYLEKARILMNQHDALTFEVSMDIPPLDFMREIQPVVEFQVEGFPDIVSEWEFGYTWGSSVRIHDDTPFSLNANGQWVVEGKAEPIERDEDEFEEEMLPQTGGYHDIVGPALPEDPFQFDDLRPVVIEVGRRPTPSEFQALLALLASKPGQYSARLRTPTGEVSVWEGTAIGAGASAEVALVLPGSTVYHPEEHEVDASSLAEVLA